jgi:hypothetical protein
MSISFGWFCHCIVFLKSGLCPSVVLLLDHFKDLSVPLNQRYLCIHTNHAGTVVTRSRKRRYGGQLKSVPGCPKHEALGLVLGSPDVPPQLLFLMGQSVKQLKRLRTARGARVPDDFFFGEVIDGDSEARYLNFSESLEVLIRGTALGEGGVSTTS